MSHEDRDVVTRSALTLLPRARSSMIQPGHQNAAPLLDSLPNELIVKIIHELAEREENGHLTKSSNLALARCALVNRTFCLYSQEQIFSRLSVHQQNLKRISRMSIILKRSAHLRDMVKSVELICVEAGAFHHIVQQSG